MILYGADFDDLAQQTGAHQRRSPDFGAEGGPVHRGTAAGGEHQTTGAGRVAALVHGEQVDYESGQRHDPAACPRLRVGLAARTRG
jgi:hypothetical protein